MLYDIIVLEYSIIFHVLHDYVTMTWYVTAITVMYDAILNPNFKSQK